MDKIRQYIENNRQQAMILGGVGLVVLIGVVFLLMKALSPAPPEDSASGGGFAPPSPGGTGFPGGGPQASSPLPGGGPPMPGPTPMPGGPPTPGGPPQPPGQLPSSGQPSALPEGASGDPLAASLAGDQGGLAAPAAAKPAVKQKSLYKPRPDPFAAPGVDKLDKRKIAALQRKLLNDMREQALRAQMATLPVPSIYRPKRIIPVDPNTQQQPTEVPVVRRTAGLLYGDRVLGVLETDGRTNVVKLGDVLTSGPDRVRVTKIDRNGITLRKLGKEGGVIVVPLKNAPEGGVVGGPAGGGMPMPGGPMFRRGGGPPMPGGPPLPG